MRLWGILTHHPRDAPVHPAPQQQGPFPSARSEPSGKAVIARRTNPMLSRDGGPGLIPPPGFPPQPPPAEAAKEVLWKEHSDGSGRPSCSRVPSACSRPMGSRSGRASSVTTGSPGPCCLKQSRSGSGRALRLGAGSLGVLASALLLLGPLHQVAKPILERLASAEHSDRARAKEIPMVETEIRGIERQTCDVHDELGETLRLAPGHRGDPDAARQGAREARGALPRNAPQHGADQGAGVPGHRHGVHGARAFPESRPCSPSRSWRARAAPEGPPSPGAPSASPAIGDRCMACCELRQPIRYRKRPVQSRPSRRRRE